MTRRPHDYYPTPAWCVHTIMRRVQIPDNWIEPCVGDGAIIRAVGKLPWSAYDIRDVGLGAPRDMTEPWDGIPRHDMCMTNPPFSCWQPILEHAIANCDQTLALLRLSVMAGKKRERFWRGRPADVYVLPKRPSFTGDGKTDGSDYAWFHWHHGLLHRHPIWQRLDDI